MTPDSRHLLRRVRWLLLSAGLSAAAASAQQALPDPTRPPASMRQKTPVEAVLSETPVLQSVLIARDRRRAVISGETVTVGGLYGDARVVRITETEVVLKNAGGMTTLKLFPQVEKKMRDGGGKPASALAAQRTSAVSGKKNNDA